MMEDVTMDADTALTTQQKALVSWSAALAHGQIWWSTSRAGPRQSRAEVHLGHIGGV